MKKVHKILIAAFIGLFIVISFAVNTHNDSEQVSYNSTYDENHLDISETEFEKSPQAIENEGLTQEEINEKLKAKAVQADFVELNVDTPPEGKKVYVDGEVGNLIDGVLDEFIITAKEGDGYGMYKIQLANTTDLDYGEGDIVRVYGSVYEKDELGFPQILGTILEKHEGELAEKYSPTSTVITKAESDQIKKGMTYDEVVNIIGEEGVLDRESRMTSGIITAYKWKNDDGGYAFIQFMDKNTGTPVVADFMFVDLN